MEQLNCDQKDNDSNNDSIGEEYVNNLFEKYKNTIINDDTTMINNPMLIQCYKEYRTLLKKKYNTLKTINTINENMKQNTLPHWLTTKISTQTYQIPNNNKQIQKEMYEQIIAIQKETDMAKANIYLGTLMDEIQKMETQNKLYIDTSITKFAEECVLNNEKNQKMSKFAYILNNSNDKQNYIEIIAFLKATQKAEMSYENYYIKNNNMQKYKKDKQIWTHELNHRKNKNEIANKIGHKNGNISTENKKKKRKIQAINNENNDNLQNNNNEHNNKYENNLAMNKNENINNKQMNNQKNNGDKQYMSAETYFSRPCENAKNRINNNPIHG